MLQNLQVKKHNTGMIVKLSPEEEAEAQADERRGRLLDELEDGETINKEELTPDEKFLVWKHTYQRKEV